MNTTHGQKEKGFTIIEVVLVLAIAALIMLMVFLALPALQRGQRDNARKNDAGIIGSAITAYKSNHNGDVPASWSDLTSYVGDLAQYTKGTAVADSDVVFHAKTDASQDGSGKLSKIDVYMGAKCDAAGTRIDHAASTRQAAIIYRVEANGANAEGNQICQNV